MLDAIELLEELEEKFFEKGWNEVDLEKYWLACHKAYSSAPRLTPRTYKTKAILKKFLASSDEELPRIIRFAIENRRAIQTAIPEYDGGLISFCFKYIDIQRLANTEMLQPKTVGVY